MVDGTIQIRQRVNLTISVDHRISDGAEAARFLQVLAKYLEEPLRLMV
ncbi:MAG: 2-oxo acid dehydrogenase subunit E2 [Anaerolineales bacterium]